MILRTVLVLSAAAGLALAAQEAKKEDTKKEAAPAGVVAVKDAATGKIRQATPEEIGALAKAARQSERRAVPEISVEFTTRTGVRAVKLGADSITYMVVTKKADGKLAETCVTGEKAAKDAVTNDTGATNEK